MIVDEFSAWCWAVPLKSLTEMHATVSHLLEVSLHQRNDRFVKHWRTDGGTENTNAQMADLFRTHGIEHELSCPGTSHQNGKAERHIGILFSTMRTLLSDARLPPSLWAEAMCCAVYVHNRTPGPSGPSPFELRYGRPPVVSHLRPFGCACAVTSTVGSLARPDKSSAAAVEATLLGYGYISCFPMVLALS